MLDLKTAIAMLGFVEVRNLALTVYVARTCESPSQSGGYSREKLWHHMIAVGLISRLIAETSGKTEPEEAYVAGLLHDLGKLLIDQFMPRALGQVPSSTMDTVGSAIGLPILSA